MQELTRTEERVMLIVWKLKKAFVKDIIEQMPGSSKPPYNTVSSVARILVRKGFLGYTAYGHTHEYHPLLEKSKYRRHQLGLLLKRYYGNSALKLFSDLLKDDRIQKGEIRKIKELIKQHSQP